MTYRILADKKIYWYLRKLYEADEFGSFHLLESPRFYRRKIFLSINTVDHISRLKKFNMEVLVHKICLVTATKRNLPRVWCMSDKEADMVTEAFESQTKVDFICHVTNESLINKSNTERVKVC